MYFLLWQRLVNFHFAFLCFIAIFSSIQCDCLEIRYEWSINEFERAVNWLAGVRLIALVVV